MALHWEEARVIVTFGDVSEVGEVPDDAIVLTLKPEEAEEPETIEAVRNLVLDRTIERRRQMINEAYELGTSMPEPILKDAGDASEEVAQAERSLLESLRDREEDVAGRDWGEAGPSAFDESGLWLGGDAGGGVRIFISRVEELVVHN